MRPSVIFPVAQTVKNLPVMQETRVRSVGREDPLEKGTAILTWRIPWTEEPGGLRSMGLQKLDTTERLTPLLLLSMQETWVLSLDQEDPLDKEMATHSSILAWKIPWTEDTGGLRFMRLKRIEHG